MKHTTWIVYNIKLQTRNFKHDLETLWNWNFSPNCSCHCENHIMTYYHCCQLVCGFKISLQKQKINLRKSTKMSQPQIKMKSQGNFYSILWLRFQKDNKMFFLTPLKLLKQNPLFPYLQKLIPKNWLSLFLQYFIKV